MGVGKRKSGWTAVLSSVVLSLFVLGVLVFSFFRWMAPALEIGLPEIHRFCARLAPFVVGVLLIVLGVSLRASKQREFDERLDERIRAGNLFAVGGEEPAGKAGAEAPGAQAAKAVAELAAAPQTSFEMEPEAAPAATAQAAAAATAAAAIAAEAGLTAPAAEEEEPDALALEISEEISKIALEEAFVSTIDDNDPTIRAIDAVVLAEEDSFDSAPDIDAVDRRDFRACVEDELESATRLGYDISFARMFDVDPDEARKVLKEAADLFVMGDGSLLCVLPFYDLDEAGRLCSAVGGRFVSTSRRGRPLDLATVVRELS